MILTIRRLIAEDAGTQSVTISNRHYDVPLYSANNVQASGKKWARSVQVRSARPVQTSCTQTHSVRLLPVDSKLCGKVEPLLTSK